ncbi:MAG: polyribonucleotide nucleotidyltransferase [Cytophagales bacterium CG12_big_fil_rev_8_21_14_0_65_40_12]|nr:MAG: polyribonucleotide nucleotidyltransferase [Cytophagales bacterium CG12_big_fil_rev_8_21_14_0_65_40_12]PIW05630.1 MAG: polyribonucleotide nucleotidyltransferase [Cytophagales bacterium CG17_big_fil_post_rev_8_21_14_2_50_40_13]
MLNVITKTIEMPDGQIITIETGKLAKQSDGSAVVKMGNTMLLATVVASQDAKEDVDFLPLSVDYQEKFASAGKIPGGFLKREGRLSDHEILISRLVDRALRPLFPDDFHADTQVMISMISHDENVMPDALAALAASAAIAVSDIPFNGPISEVRVVKHNGEFKVNPSKAVALVSDLDIIVAASMDNIMMVEGEMNEASEADMLEAMKIAHDAIKIQCKAQMELSVEAGKTVKREYDHEKSDLALYEKMKAELYDQLYASVAKKTADKSIRSSDIKAIKNAWMESLPEDHGYNGFLMSQYFKKIHKSAARNFVLNDQKRLDGRDFTEIRQIWGEVDYLPSAHGSAVFTRGETQSLTSCTLGTKLDEQMIDGATENGYNKFILHYNFPGFSTGEVRPNRGPGRREVGHGNLAMRALKKVLPAPENNPYTIRIVSDILESNGSSSMATVCAGTMALLDTGVKIIAPVSGIAMGMISDSETGKYAILSDILGDEDHLGDMDFKVTGTEKGITACQMDIKVDGLSYEVLEKALNQAREGRLHILGEMKKVIAEPREDYKPHVPRSEKVIIGKDQIGAVIGPGGKVVQEIQKSTGATVIIEEEANNGVVTIFADNKEAMQAALSRIKAIVAIPEVGEVYEGKVKSIMPFGAFVEFMPGKDGLLHISEIKWERVEKMDGIMEVGEEVTVKLVEIDKKTGKYRLSRKALLPKPEKDSSTKED